VFWETHTGGVLPSTDVAFPGASHLPLERSSCFTRLRACWSFTVGGKYSIKAYILPAWKRNYVEQPFRYFLDLSGNFPLLKEHQDSFPCSQLLTTGPCPNPESSRPNFHMLLLSGSVLTLLLVRPAPICRSGFFLSAVHTESFVFLTYHIPAHLVFLIRSA
jgi:hypothetical protein